MSAGKSRGLPGGGGGHRPPLRKIMLGTRGSALALTQARMAAAALREKCGIETQIEIIRASGDENVVLNEAEGSRGESLKVTSAGSLGFARDDKAGRKGLFTAELERALLDGRIDVAVHSAKDLPSETDASLSIAAVLPRGAVEDVLVTRESGVSSFSIIATGSVRRERQARWSHKAREIVPLRGNVPTRLRKFAASDWDAIILAYAGLERLGYGAPQFDFEGRKFYLELLPIEQFVPAGGQGIIAFQTRAADAALLSPVDHLPTHQCLRAERELLRLLQGDCDLPVGVHARFVDEAELELRVQLFGDDQEPATASARGANPEKVAEEAFSKLQHDHDHEYKHE